LLIETREIPRHAYSMFSLRRKEMLERANITHVLSVLSLPLDKVLFAPYKHMVVKVDDVEDENLLEHFTTTNGFIEEGLEGGGGVLVHWWVRHPSSPSPKIKV
jgi:dual specificity phosphatase 12